MELNILNIYWNNSSNRWFFLDSERLRPIIDIIYHTTDERETGKVYSIVHTMFTPNIVVVDYD